MCGNDVCDATETCSSCTPDCGPCETGGGNCGDFSCDLDESCETCPGDCGPCTGGESCGDFFCDFDEDCSTCELDCGPCGGASCGDFFCDFDEDCSTCELDCGSCGGTGDCSHDVCTGGGPLDPSCDACTSAVCSADTFCCTDSWDTYCIDEATSLCGAACTGGGGGGCAHDYCVAGGPLDPSCDPCVDAICFEDAFCCLDSWDSYCMDEVYTVCGELCF
jgi:hypothetical protein